MVLLRRVIWIGLSALALVVARKAAERVFRVATGEEPPTKK
jgi:hypothetical protein